MGRRTQSGKTEAKRCGSRATKSWRMAGADPTAKAGWRSADALHCGVDQVPLPHIPNTSSGNRHIERQCAGEGEENWDELVAKGGKTEQKFGGEMGGETGGIAENQAPEDNGVKCRQPRGAR